MDLLLWKSNVITASRKRKKPSVISNSVPDNNIVICCYNCRCVTWTLELQCCPVTRHVNIGACGFWSGSRNLTVVILLRNKLQSNPYSKELRILRLFKDWVQWLNLSQHSQISADQMHLQSLKVMFLEVTCMKIPVRAHKLWFTYTGISKYKSESVHKHWSFHTYMQAKYTKLNTFSEHDLCKNMYSNCRPPRRHT